VRCRRRQGRGERAAGFSLLEVLLASIIFSITFAGLAASWKYHELSLRKYRNRNAARFLLSQEMERVMAHPYSNLQDGVQDTTQWLYREIDGVVSKQAFEISGDVDENAEETLKDVTIAVTFEENNEVRTMELRSRAFRSQ
jgi:prepilin-type N-terminal cleavage/methylation domain-containing protein